VPDRASAPVFFESERPRPYDYPKPPPAFSSKLANLTTIPPDSKESPLLRTDPRDNNSSNSVGAWRPPPSFQKEGQPPQQQQQQRSSHDTVSLEIFQPNGQNQPTAALPRPTAARPSPPRTSSNALSISFLVGDLSANTPSVAPPQGRGVGTGAGGGAVEMRGVEQQVVTSPTQGPGEHLLKDRREAFLFKTYIDRLSHWVCVCLSCSRR